MPADDPDFPKATDPYSVDWEAEALRRGAALLAGRYYGKGAPVVLVRAQWEAFRTVQGRRKKIHPTWRKVARRYGEARRKFEEAGPGLIALDRFAWKELKALSITWNGRFLHEMNPRSDRDRAHILERLLDFLRRSHPRKARALLGRLRDELGQWDRLRRHAARLERALEPMQTQLEAIRLEWNQAWDELRRAVRGKDRTHSLFSKLYLRRGLELSRERLPGCRRKRRARGRGVAARRRRP